MLILGFDESAHQTQLLATALGQPFATVTVHRFPDGESSVTIPTQLPHTVVFMISLDHPNNKLIELMLALAAAREQGAEHIVLVAPYLCYMRQDMAFEPGQAVSQRIIGDWLSAQVDALITIDPHLHRIQHLKEAYPHCTAISLSAASIIGAHIAQRYENAVLVGPDEESEQWVSVAADVAQRPWCVASKVRRGDRDVSVMLPQADFEGKQVVLLDDVISSGHTIQQAALALTAAGCRQVNVACTHALFAPGAADALKAAGIAEIMSCNSIPHPSNAIDLSPLLAEAVQRCVR